MTLPSRTSPFVFRGKSDFVQDRTRDGRKFRMLTVIDEFTRECLAIDVARRLNSQSVLAVLADLMVQRGVPDHIRSG